jgi:hypothetical protein
MQRDNPDFITGHDIPGGDGGVGDEQVNAIDEDGSGKPIGQDHSTDNYEATEPTDGVGAIQDRNLIKEHIAHIEDQDS